METISTILSLLAFAGIIYFFKIYFPSYFKEKGKNLAQKEDIAAITAEVERVRTDYALQIEKVKSDLSKSSYVHKLQFETEFQAFQEIWKKLLGLRNQTLSLRPIIDIGAQSAEEFEERKKQRLKDFTDSFNDFVLLAETNKPFYPQSIWNELEALILIVRKEAVGYSFGDPDDGKKYWDEALANRDKILAKIDLICEAIRNRIDPNKIL